MGYFKMAILLFIISAPTINGFGQSSHFTKSDHWKNQRKSLLLGGGITNFLGDIGGRNKEGTHFSPLDIDWNSTSFAGHLGFRYRLASNFATKTLLQYGLFAGNDTYTHQYHRRNRNIQFQTHLFEISQQFELILVRNEQFGSRHRKYGLKGFRPKDFQVYLFSGVSFFGFIPQGRGGGYGWTNLRPLKTEGQGLSDDTKAYERYSFGIPVGVGYKIGLSPMWSLSCELSYTHTFTDYLDDVSGNYYDNDLIESNYGSKAAYFADPSLGPFPELTSTGKPRGNSDYNDVYLYFNISFIRNVSYKRTIKTKRKHSR
ncbi:MAG: hypothetical protein GQ574_04310 [Crocinitomix sp.]|nr:hypothetical protein [Crocinitomix sp.]